MGDSKGSSIPRFTPNSTSSSSSSPSSIVKAKPSILPQGVPADIDGDPRINAAIGLLPSNYNFEVKKSIWKLRTFSSKCVALQFPEGLLQFSCLLADILNTFTGAECIIMGDVTYGACCVDDLGAAALGADFLIHYGHSCLVPIDATSAALRMLYVFVDVAFDTAHLVATVRANFPRGASLALLGTIQFGSSLAAARGALLEDFPTLCVPQAKPLSPGEVLGCTSPDLSTAAGRDGRFHLESVMIHNPTIPAYRYDPYGKRLTREHFDTPLLMAMRRAAIDAAAKATTFGIILGTLGRQGNLALLQRLEKNMRESGRRTFVLLLSELSPAKLALFENGEGRLGLAKTAAADGSSEISSSSSVSATASASSTTGLSTASIVGPVEAWIQIACPRLSIDWGAAFSKPLLTTYEAEVMMGGTIWRDVYPMDYYARGSGPWTNYFK